MSSRPRSEVIVYLDAPELGLQRAVGVLYATPGTRPVISFLYARSWLNSSDRFSIDPELPIAEYELFVHEGELPGVFADIAPDRWGRTLIQRRENLTARQQGRAARTLADWDFLLGVSDITRMGALRLADEPGGDVFIGNDDARPVPPFARLRSLEFAARELERTNAPSPGDESEWLNLLLAPGSSLGGARPKATFVDTVGTLWIAKFPSRADQRETGAWEFVVADLARASGIAVADHRLLTLGPEGRTFAARRFDRTGSARRLFASAMTLTAKRDGQDASYIDVATAIADYGVPSAISTDLEELFRRVCFNVVVANRDDHLRNHAFLRVRGGWRLAPAFDMNPTPDQAEHSLAIDETDQSPDLDLVLDTADWYRLKRPRAEEILGQVSGAVATWRARAVALGIARNEIELMAPTFDAVA